MEPSAALYARRATKASTWYQKDRAPVLQRRIRPPRSFGLDLSERRGSPSAEPARPRFEPQQVRAAEYDEPEVSGCVRVLADGVLYPKLALLAGPIATGRRAVGNGGAAGR